jgi:hypothetical protein
MWCGCDRRRRRDADGSGRNRDFRPVREPGSRRRNHVPARQLPGLAVGLKQRLIPFALERQHSYRLLAYTGAL